MKSFNKICNLSKRPKIQLFNGDKDRYSEYCNWKWLLLNCYCYFSNWSIWESLVNYYGYFCSIFFFFFRLLAHFHFHPKNKYWIKTNVSVSWQSLWGCDSQSKDDWSFATCSSLKITLHINFCSRFMEHN